jgi:hypothetical protein
VSVCILRRPVCVCVCVCMCVGTNGKSFGYGKNSKHRSQNHMVKKGCLLFVQQEGLV